MLAFYERLARQIKEKKVGPSQITNVDEHGLRQGHTKAGVVVGSTLTKRVYVSKSDSTAWVTIIEAITALGRRLTLVVIFTGEKL